MANEPDVSVILSFRNEEAVIPELVKRLQAALRGIPVAYELVFVNDDSSDKSLEMLRKLREDDACVKVVNMSRRWGVSECALAGMKYATGRAIVYMDADLQDPPEVIPQLVAKWREGADVVYTVRTARAGEPAMRMLGVKIAYRLIRAMSSTKLEIEAGDFKLLSRRVVEQLLQLRERDPYLRGLVTWLGFKQVAVPYERQARAAGETHFPMLTNRAALMTIVNAIVAFSTVPLVMFLFLGMLACFVGVVTPVVALGSELAGGPVFEHWKMTTIVAILWGIPVMGLGIVGLYLSRVHAEVRNRPSYIVESTEGF